MTVPQPKNNLARALPLDCLTPIYEERLFIGPRLLKLLYSLF